MATHISAGNESLQVLESLVHQMLASGCGTDFPVPVVLVSGFSGWGEPLFGNTNYRGGFEDLPGLLNESGYMVILVRIGPLSSNWERVYEVYAQLTMGREFNTPMEYPPKYTLIDFGIEYPARYGYKLISTTKAAVLYGNLPYNWSWGKNNSVHFICPSQGGNTIRMLVELMNETCGVSHPVYFPPINRQNWIRSVVTLGTPHKGSTITDVVQKLLPTDAMDLITRLVVSALFKVPRSYNLQPDHWGFSREYCESFIEMHARLLPKVQLWWEGQHNGFYDGIDERSK